MPQPSAEEPRPTALDTVVSNGGRIVKFVGDSCLATFAEDDAQRAIDCATSLRDDVRRIAQRFEVAIDLAPTSICPC